MNAHSPVLSSSNAYMRGIDRKGLARHAYTIACGRLAAMRDAGLIDAGEALVKYRKLRAAYQSRVERIGLERFLRARGLGRYVLGDKPRHVRTTAIHPIGESV